MTYSPSYGGESLWRSLHIWPSEGGRHHTLCLARLHPMLPLVRASEQELVQENAVLVQVLDGDSMVQTWPFKQLLEVAQGALCRLPALRAVSVGR